MTLQTKVRKARAPRIMLYSHDTLGYGHLRRNLLIAMALSELDPQPEILVVCGMREAGAFEVPPRTDCLTLPAYAKQGDGSYRPRALGQDIARLARMRARTIRGAAEAFDPDLFIVDNVPRGAQFELDDTLQALARTGRCRLVLGLRDVIDDSATVRRQWLRQRNFETVRRFYDAVWIYGDPAIYDLLEDCGMGAALGGRARFVGHLDPARRGMGLQADIDAAAILAQDRRPYVFCALGGGRDGAVLGEAFVRAPMPEGHRGLLVTGMQMAEDLRDGLAATAAARTDMTVLPFLREPFGVMGAAARLVGMGGYNTTREVLSLRVPALIVPRCAPRREQVMRTSRLAARGLVSMLLPEEVSPQAIGEWLARAAPPAPHAIDMRGLDRIRHLAAALCDGRAEALLPDGLRLPLDTAA